MSVRRALPLIGAADLSRRTAGRPGVSRPAVAASPLWRGLAVACGGGSEAIRGMPSSVSGESRRRLGGSARLRSRGRASAADPSVQRSRVAVRVLSGVPRASRPAVADSPLWRGLAVALCAEAEARYPTPGLRSRADAGRCEGHCRLSVQGPFGVSVQGDCRGSVQDDYRVSVLACPADGVRQGECKQAGHPLPPTTNHNHQPPTS